MNKRKLAFALILMLLVTALVSSCFVAPFIATHDCHNDNCFICFYILLRENIEKAFAVLCTAVTLIALSFFFKYIDLRGICQNFKLNNLVFLKVKLSD